MGATDDTLEVGDVWAIELSADSGATVAVSVTNPSGVVTNSPEEVIDGLVTISVPLTEEGRYLAVVTVTTDLVPDVTAFTVYAETPGGKVPDLEMVKEYLDESSETDEAIQGALTAETRAQARVCNIPADYPEDLAEALMRRVARNLAARKVPIAQITSFDGGQQTSRVPARDNEVQRLEGPYRKTVLA